MLVLVLLIVLALAGPLAYFLTKFKPKNLMIKLLKRIVQSVLLVAAIVVAPIFLFSTMPLLLRLAGLVVLVVVFMTIRKEYFPGFSVINKIKARLNNRSRID